ncbi:MAG TPA: hypothetical protein VNW15_07610 [Rhizomicrobium sp.]|nr:hypothetical protein [Rhizomicrobium sp.]
MAEISVHDFKNRDHVRYLTARIGDFDPPLPNAAAILQVIARKAARAGVRFDAGRALLNWAWHSSSWMEALRIAPVEMKTQCERVCTEKVSFLYNA